MNFGWLWCVNLGSSVVTMYHSIGGDTDIVQTYACVLAWEYKGNLCTFLSILLWTKIALKTDSEVLKSVLS